MKTVLLILVVVATFEAYLSCKHPPNCIPRGDFCHAGTWTDCCCPDGCLGLIVGVCFGTTKEVNGVMSYSIFDESNNELLQDTVVIDSSSKPSQDQLERILARFPNQTLYMDAHLDIYSDDTPQLKQTHKSWRHYKLN